MLSNLETEKSKLLQIILIGQPDLRDKLDRPELEQLRQRITVSYHLEPLDADETAHYINHRLARASIGAPLEFPTPGHRPHSRAQRRRAAVDQRDRRCDARVRLRRGAQRDRCRADRGSDRGSRRHRRPRSAPEREPSRVGGAGRPPPCGHLPLTAERIRRATCHTAASTATSAAHCRCRPRADGTQPPKTHKLARRVGGARERQLRRREQDMDSPRARARRTAARTWPTSTGSCDKPTSGRTAGGRDGGGVAASVGGSRTARSFATPRPRSPRTEPSPRPSLWRRVKKTLLGTAEPVLEDSL